MPSSLPRALLVGALVVAAAASGGARAAGEPQQDVYVCVDNDPSNPQVALSSKDCASGTPDVATLTVVTAAGVIVIHLKRTCMPGDCPPVACSLEVCRLDWCPRDLVCVRDPW